MDVQNVQGTGRLTHPYLHMLYKGYDSPGVFRPSCFWRAPKIVASNLTMVITDARVMRLEMKYWILVVKRITNHFNAMNVQFQEIRAKTMMLSLIHI